MSDETHYAEAMLCPRCKTVDIPAIKWQKFDNNTWHIKAECFHCKRHLKWVGHDEVTMMEVD